MIQIEEQIHPTVAPAKADPGRVDALARGRSGVEGRMIACAVCRVDCQGVASHVVCRDNRGESCCMCGVLTSLPAKCLAVASLANVKWVGRAGPRGHPPRSKEGERLTPFDLPVFCCSSVSRRRPFCFPVRGGLCEPGALLWGPLFSPLGHREGLRETVATVGRGWRDGWRKGRQAVMYHGSSIVRFMALHLSVAVCCWNVPTRDGSGTQPSRGRRHLRQFVLRVVTADNRQGRE